MHTYTFTQVDFSAIICTLYSTTLLKCVSLHPSESCIKKKKKFWSTDVLALLANARWNRSEIWLVKELTRSARVLKQHKRNWCKSKKRTRWTPNIKHGRRANNVDWAWACALQLWFWETSLALFKQVIWI